MARIAEAFGIRSEHIETISELKEKVSAVLESDGPALCTVKADITQKILPKQVNYVRPDGQMASRPLEDMAPLLEPDELKAALYSPEGV